MASKAAKQERPKENKEDSKEKLTTQTRLGGILKSLPIKVTSKNSSLATLRLLAAVCTCFFSFHAISMAPPWALPICWLFAALSMCAVFEIGNDCAGGHYFGSSAVNSFFGVFFLTGVFQPMSFWAKLEQRPFKGGWRAALAKSWRFSLSLSHLAVFVFAAVFFPMMLYTVGPWGLVKYWVIPFVLFHVGMAIYINAAGSLFKESATFKRVFALRSYMRFHIGVPTYRMGEAMDVFNRMWNRAAVDSSDAPAPSISELLEDPAYQSLQLGYLSGYMVHSALGLVLLPATLLWLYLAYSSAVHHSITYTFSALSSFAQNSVDPVLWQTAWQWLSSVSTLGVLTVIIVAVWLMRKFNRHRKVYLVDFVTYTPPPELKEQLKLDSNLFKTLQRASKTFSEDSLEFMDRLIDRTGLGDETYFPPGIMKVLTGPPECNLKSARVEAELVIFGSIEQLFAVTGCTPKDIDILVVNCSLFCPTPSLASMIVNKYKMREDIQSYSLGGMGCSAGVIAIHLAKDLLQVYPNSRALVVSTENITQNWYRGNERGMLLSNTLFRVGGAAVLLSNRKADRSISKYRLAHSIRTHMGARDESYNAVFQDQDKDGIVGVRLDKDLMKVAGEALKRNITQLGPLILPWSEQIRYFMNVFNRKVRKVKIPPYIPNFRKAVDHFCIHAGGRAVLEAIEKALSLDPKHLEASRFVLSRYGNTSSSSIWYELAHLEKIGAIRKGNVIWQIAFGSGFKCNSAVWKAL